MPLVYGRSLQLPVRADDGAVQRRRMLQDLERQWLAAWGQIGQAQGPLRPASEAADVTPPLRADVVVHQAPAPTDANAPRPDEPLPSRASSDRSSVVNDHGSESRRERKEAEPVVQHRDMAAGKAAAAAETGSVPVAPAGLAPAAGAASSPAPMSAKLVAPGAAAGPSLQPAGAGEAVLAPPAIAAVMEGGTGRMAVPEFRQGAPVFAQTSVAQLQPVTEIGQGAGPVAPPAGPLASDGPDQEQAEPPLQRRAAFAPADIPDPGPRRLMLRELNEQEVLASMRDAQLTSAESALAAQGLARALMQAGYARVQVFVNGRQHQHAADGDGAADPKADKPQAAGAPRFTPNSEIRHGH